MTSGSMTSNTPIFDQLMLDMPGVYHTPQAVIEDFERYIDWLNKQMWAVLPTDLLRDWVQMTLVSAP
jgi:hypothetical protein